MQTKDIKKMTITEAIETYRDIKIKLTPTLDTLKQLEKRIKSELLQTGELVQVDGIKATFHKGYVRSSWNNKSLRGYAAANPEILQFVKETEIKPTVVLKIE